MKTVLLAALVCLLLGTANAVTHYTWNYNRVGADPSIGTQRPYYDLGYIYQDNTIEVNLTAPGITSLNLNNLNVRIINKADSSSVATADTCSTTALTCTLTFPLTTGGNYYALITDTTQPTASTAMKLFYL